MANFCILNDFDLKKPPLITLQVADTGFAKNVFVAINRFLKQFSEPNALEFDKTAALIGRLMARRKNSFRGMPGYRAVSKLNAALCRLLRLDLPRELEHLRGALPDAIDDQISGDMPTRSSLEFVLARLINFYQLHVRIRHCCVDSAKYFGQMLRNNFFMEFLTVLIAAIAKINKLSLLQANSCAALYNKLLPQRFNFPSVERHSFLAENCQLPAKLRSIKVTRQPSQDEETIPATIILAPQPPAVLTKVDKEKQKLKADVGTVVKRPTPTATGTSSELDSLATVEDVKRFILRESKARANTPDSCFTKALQNHEWLASKTLFERKLLAGEHVKAINIYRKFISSKI